MFVRVFACRFLSGIKCVCRYGFYKSSMLDTLEADKAVRELLHLNRPAVDDQDFEARVVVKMRMTRGHDQIVVLVLQLGQFFANAVRMMIVDKSDGSDHRCIRSSRLLCYEPVPDHVSKGLGTVCVTAAFNGAVEPLEQVRIDGNTDAAESTHTCPFKWFILRYLD